MRKLAKVYWPFALNQIKVNFAYKGRFYFYIAGRILRSFITYYLWMSIYSSSASAVMGGFTQKEMVTYVFMSYVVSGVISVSILQEIGFHVVDGTIAINLLKPIDYRISLMFKAFGNMIYRFVVPSVFIWIGLEIYRVQGLGLSVTSIDKILLFLISSFMSFLIYILLDYCFGMLAFFTTYIFGMNIIKIAILTFLSGQIIPLSFFPKVVQAIFEYLPFASLNYVPVMIYLGKYNASQIAIALLKQGVWIVAIYLLGSFLWKKITKRLIVLGG